MVDTHAHLSICKPGDDELVAAALEAGVRRILTIGMSEESNREAIAAAEAHEGVFASLGRHPNAANRFDQAAADDLASLAAHPKVRAIGETGLDFFREIADPEDQRRAFSAQIRVAVDARLPIVIHVRDPEGSSDAVDEAFATLDAEAAGATVILHCFSAPARVHDAVERGWYCSFAGNVTYPGAGAIREAAMVVPDHLILAETDSPFLSPVPHRGKPNQPANVVATAALLATERGVSAFEMEASIERNASAVFGW